MTYQEKMKWLGRYQAALSYQHMLEDEIEVLRSDAERVTTCMSGMPGRGGARAGGRRGPDGRAGRGDGRRGAGDVSARRGRAGAALAASPRKSHAAHAKQPPAPGLLRGPPVPLGMRAAGR